MNIYDVVDRQRAALLAREYETVRDIVAAYEIAEAKVEASIRAFQEKIRKAQAAGVEPSLAWYYQEARLENILREIRGHLDEFSKDALLFAEKGRSDAYQLGAVHAVRLAEASVIGDVAGLPAGAFANAQALLSASSPLKALFDEIGPFAAEKAREVFAKGVAEGWNPRKLGRELAREIDGVSKSRAILIARTEQIRAYRTANADIYSKNADVLRGWRWTSAKTPATCAMCLALDGEIFPVTETLSSHPACRCSMVPLPKTDFGGPKPSSGAEYFARLSPKEQDRILGKAKGAMYRKGELTLADNVRFKTSPEWGKTPAPRTLSEIGDLRSKRLLPSQTGNTRLSGYEAPPAISLDERLSRAEAAANDPKKKALAAWSENQLYPSGHRKIDFKAVKPPPYKKRVTSLAGLDSTVEEVDLASLISTLPSAPSEKVVRYIEDLGDGPDLPVVFRSEGKLYIHNGESVARLQAKLLLGQTKASVRLFDADALLVARTPLEEATDAVKALGVEEVRVLDAGGTGATEADVLKALAFAREQIEETGVVPVQVLISKGSARSAVADRTLIVGTNLADLPNKSVADAVAVSPLAADQLKVLSTYGYDRKARAVRASLSQKENIEAALLRTRFLYDASFKAKEALREFGDRRLDLFSLRAFESGLVEDALDEAIILYRRGEYRIGSLPEKLETAFLDQAEAVLGKKPVLPAYSDAENFLFLNVGGQGGSNPGGMYLGRDGIRRYVKFYDNEERGLVEKIANDIYARNGIEVPVSTVFERNGKKAFATEIVEGKTLQQLGGVSAVKIEALKDAFDGYMTDAFLANWDVVGLSADNMMVNSATGKIVRIDNGGTFIFRAQGGDKPDSVLGAFEEFFSLGDKSSKGYEGQFKPILKRLGYDSVEEALVPLKKQAESLGKTLDSIATDRAGWIAYFDATAPGLSEKSKNRMADMMVKRRKLLEDKVAELEKKAKGLKTKAKKAEAGKAGKKAREAAIQAGKKPLTKARFDKILAAPEADWGIQTTSTAEYGEWLSRHTDKAFDRMSPEARAAARDYSGSSYNAIYNEPQRAFRKTGKAISDYSQKQIAALNEAIAANEEGLKKDLRLSRKLEGKHTEEKWHNFTDLDVGTVIADSAFQSTSLRPEVWSGDVHLHITLRKGERRFIAPGRRPNDGHHPGEAELILAPDMLYVVKKVERWIGKVVIHVEVIPEGFTVPKGVAIRYSFANLFRKKDDFGPDLPLTPGGTVHNSGEVDPVTTLRHSLCANCSRKFPGAAKCDAFREGIPVEILVGALDHRSEIDGDLGLVFDPRDPTEEIEYL